jgi:hypothetical protein
MKTALASTIHPKYMEVVDATIVSTATKHTWKEKVTVEISN